MRTYATFLCEQCGSEYQREPSRNKRNKHSFCSKLCKDTHRKTLIGPDHPLYNRTTVPCTTCGKPLSRIPAKIERNTMHFCDKVCFGKWTAANQTGVTHPRYRDRVQCTCAHCRKTVYRRIWVVSNSPTGLFFCASKCQYAWMAEHQKGESHHQYKAESHIQTTCANCGQELLRDQDRLRRSPKSFCSKQCQAQWRSQNELGENNHSYRRFTVRCTICGNEVKRSASCIRPSGNVCCSQECYKELLSQRFSGANHPNWKGGRVSFRGPNWASQRRKARERDKHTCQACGAKHRKNQTLFHVHHIVPFRNFGYIPNQNDNYLQANQLSNLITLCNSCHMRAEHGKIAFQPRLL